MSVIPADVDVDRVIEAAVALDTADQWKLFDVLCKALKKSTKGVKGKRAKKERDPGVPKKEPNDFIKFASHIRVVFKANLDEEDFKIAKSVKCVTQVASALKEAGLMGTATDEQVVAAFAEWKENPPAPVTKAKLEAAKTARKAKKAAKAASDAESDAAESDADQLAAAEAAAAADAERKAKKAAKKAAKAAAKAVAPPPADDADESAAVEGVVRTYKINGKETKFDAYPDDERPNCEYLYTAIDGVYKGSYNTVTKKLDKDVPNPMADE